MIRLTEDVMVEVQKRGCGPLENFIFGIRIQMWPVFQKLMAEHIDALKKYTDGTGTGLFRQKSSTDAAVATVSFLSSSLTCTHNFTHVHTLCPRLLLFSKDRLPLRCDLQLLHSPHRPTG